MAPNEYARFVKNIYSTIRMMVIKRKLEKHPEPNRKLENGKKLNINLDKLPPEAMKDYYDRPFKEIKDPEVFIKKYEFDKTGYIPLFKLKKLFKNQYTIHYHPVRICEFGLNIYFFNLITPKKEFLNQFIKIADWFVENIVLRGDVGYWFYTNEFALHNGVDIMKPPYASALAQGEILSLLAKAYKETSNPKYLKASKHALNSFYITKGNENWITYIDENNNVWFEEFPYIYPTHVLNGHTSAIIGLLDYYFITNDKNAEELINMGLYTIKNNLSNYDAKNVSYYCLRHKVQTSKYHPVHIRQMKYLYQLTKINEFGIYARKWEDYLK